MSNDFLWVEKYRPKTISDAILPNDLKEKFQKVVETGELQNMLLTGTAGLGKTTVAKAICNELNLDYIIINGSEEGNIDVLRGKIKQFASSVSLQGNIKVVILDEADYLNPQSTQPALRGFIEEFANNCRFILTCNFKNRIIQPLHSRCAVYEFNTNKKILSELCPQFLTRCQAILDGNGITYNKMMVADICLSLSRQKEDKVLGTGRVHVMKNRYGQDGMTYNVKMDTNNAVSYTHLTLPTICSV